MVAFSPRLWTVADDWHREHMGSLTYCVFDILFVIFYCYIIILLVDHQNQLNSRCSRKPHFLLPSSSSWPCWGSSGRPDCRSARCSSCGRSASTCSFYLYPASGGEGWRHQTGSVAVRTISLNSSQRLNYSTQALSLTTSCEV